MGSRGRSDRLPQSLYHCLTIMICLTKTYYIDIFLTGSCHRLLEWYVLTKLTYLAAPSRKFEGIKRPIQLHMLANLYLAAGLFNYFGR